LRDPDAQLSAYNVLWWEDVSVAGFATCTWQRDRRGELGR
jgi:hypothetical protein